MYFNGFVIMRFILLLTKYIHVICVNEFITEQFSGCITLIILTQTTLYNNFVLEIHVHTDITLYT